MKKIDKVNLLIDTDRLPISKVCFDPSSTQILNLKIYLLLEFIRVKESLMTQINLLE